jgi:hypothetical protein
MTTAGSVQWSPFWRRADRPVPSLIAIAMSGRLDIVGSPEGGTRLIATIPVGAEP